MKTEQEQIKELKETRCELVPVITKKWLVIDLDRDPKIMNGE